MTAESEFRPISWPAILNRLQATGCSAMTDLTNPRLIYAKGWLFLLGGVIAGALLILEQPTLRTAGLLAICVWCFCRWYYFAFYVIEHYVDANYRFAGLGSFLRYLIARQIQGPSEPGDRAAELPANRVGEGHER